MAMRGRTAGLLIVLVLAAPRPLAAKLPDGFDERGVVTGINGATAMDFAPDGRLFLCEQIGALRVVKNDVLLPLPFVTVKVDSSWERGLLGVAFDPDFNQNHHVYVNYISPDPYPHHRISRFTADGDRAVPGSEVILFEGDNQEKLGGGVKNGHQGGAIHFGKDGKLYVAIGDQTAGAPAQDLKTLQGKILRLNRDGSIPKDNPFYRKTTGKYRAIWALGLRNPFTFAFQPGTGRMFINDVGGANEEINVGAAGANYGWPTVEHGPTKHRRFRGPIHWYKESSIAGGAFYNPPRRQFPVKYVGKYFFADFKQGWIRTLDPDNPKAVRDFLTGLGNLSIVDIKIAADGSLYYLRRLAWVRDKDYRANTGVLYKVRYTGAEAPASIAAAPADQRVSVGQPAMFRVVAGGGVPLRFQWQRDDRDIAGANGDTYTLPAVARADRDARFRCLVRNAHGTALSRPATLTVVPSFNDIESVGLDGVRLAPRPGKYTGRVTVRLTPRRSAASLRYTTDGSEPGIHAPMYRQPLVLERTTTLRFRLFQGDKPIGRGGEAVFTIAGKTPYGLPYRETLPDPRVPLTIEKAPPLLSQTGLFASLIDLKPQRGLIPYNVNVPLWSDGAAKQRWMVPGRSPIVFTPEGEWTFPAGTVFVKQFDLPIDERNPKRKRRLETRLLVVDGTGNGYGVTYKWRPDNREADLLRESRREDIVIQTASGRRKQSWYYP
ncbi:MAG: PQQ-dependent sugar dehydrogenase, partial [Gemmataceae bacterium]